MVHHLSHGTSLSAKIGLGTLGKLGVQHGSISGKSDTSQNEEGKGKLLSTRGGRLTTNGSASTGHNNVPGQVVSSGLDGCDEVANELLVTGLVVIVVVGLHAVGKAVGGFAFAGVVVEIVADLVDFVLVVVIVVIVFSEARGNALSLGKGLLEEMVAEVQGGPIVVLQVGGNIGALVVG